MFFVEGFSAKLTETSRHLYPPTEKNLPKSYLINSYIRKNNFRANDEIYDAPQFSTENERFRTGLIRCAALCSKASYKVCICFKILGLFIVFVNLNVKIFYFVNVLVKIFYIRFCIIRTLTNI